MIFHSLFRLYGVTSYNLPLYSVMENTNLNILKNVNVGYLIFMIYKYNKSSRSYTSESEIWR